MRYIIIILLLIPAISFSQTKRDYEKAIGRFVKFYNNNQADSIVNMWSEKYREHMPRMWNTDGITTLQKQYGTIKSFKYLGIDTTDPNKVAVFITKFSIAGTKTTSLTLEDNYLGTFRFITSSEGIDEMLKRAK